MTTGRTVRAYRPPWRGGVHGTTYVPETNTLWAVALNIDALAELDPNDDYRILRMVSVNADTPHGIAWYDGSIWCKFAGVRLAQRIDPNSGRVQETYPLTPNDPDPHGMAIHDGYMYYCDAGLGGGRAPNPGAAPSFVCRFRLS
jgi:streptogramin lyase